MSKHFRVYGRLSFPQLFNAKKVNPEDPNEKAAFSCSILIPHGDPQIAIIEARMLAAAQEKWPEKWQKMMLEIKTNNRFCLRDGDTKEYAGYAGHMFLSARSQSAPLVTHRDPFVRGDDGQPLVDPGTGAYLANKVTEVSGIVYGGCYVNVSVECYGNWHPKGGNRICCSLRGVQFVKDGDAFAGGPRARADDFEDLSTEDYPGVAAEIAAARLESML